MVDRNAVMEMVFDLIRAERVRQTEMWGDQKHEDVWWLPILVEEVGETSQAILHDRFGGEAAGTMEKELIEVAAVAVQWMEEKLIRRLERNEQTD